MSKLIVIVISTLDGYAAGEGGNVFEMPIDLGFDNYNLDRMRAADTMIFGATTFRAAREYWPLPADNPDAPEVEREISRLYGTLDKVVISDSLGPAETTPWTTTTAVVPRANAFDRVTKLKTVVGGDIICFGSITLWNQLLEHGLVDELHILIGPGAIGNGLPTFTQSTGRQLTLLNVQRVDESNLVALQYSVSRDR